MQKRFLLLTLSVFSLLSCSTLNSVLSQAGTNPLTSDEVGKGLKEALTIGISKGAEALAKVDGYYKSPYKILIPAEAQTIANKLRVIPGFADFEEQLTEKLNRAAEDAAQKAKPIFVDAITSMTIGDAWNILKGPEDAATSYLKQETYQQLYDAFKPVIVNSLEKVNALTYWESAVTAYNKIPLVKKMNPKLDDYVDTQALNGLFSMVQKEEKEIRTNVGARTTDLLRRVFSQQGRG
ncbi:MAG: DUF4197 domain-containing protein [Saprospiraceae bacterium]|nr:DUF4197 domain-containing protein [Saprospiraceae bacterium]